MNQTAQQAITPPAITMIPVTSSQIHSIGHRPETSTLRIQFADRRNGEPGSVYEYANVDADLFDEFRNAKSVGSFFYANIKPKTDVHPFTRIYQGDPGLVAQQPVETESAPTIADAAAESVETVASGVDDDADEDDSFPDDDHEEDSKG